MARNYNLHPKQKKKSVNDTGFIIGIVIITVIGMVFLLKPAQKEIVPEAVQEASTESDVITSELETEVPATPVSMMRAGTILAEKQNALITENDKYLLTSKNALKNGYQDAVLMTDTYKQMLADFNKQYMSEKPEGLQGVLWSEFGVWEFSADYDYASEENSSMKAVWMCYDKSDTDKIHPYAVCTATYVTASDKFIEPKLYKTEWYPSSPGIIDEEMIKAAGAPNDVNVSADQCGDLDAANGSNDDGDMTEEQKRVRDELQKMIDSGNTKENAVSIGH